MPTTAAQLSSADPVSRIGEHVKWLRKERGWSQERLAIAADLATKTVFAVENGQAIRLATLNKIARALDISLKDLLTSA